MATNTSAVNCDSGHVHSKSEGDVSENKKDDPLILKIKKIIPSDDEMACDVVALQDVRATSKTWLKSIDADREIVVVVESKAGIASTQCWIG